MNYSEVKKLAEEILEIADALEQEMAEWIEEIQRDFLEIMLTDVLSIKEKAKKIILLLGEGSPIK